jgi:hypothetical protein
MSRRHLLAHQLPRWLGGGVLALAGLVLLATLAYQVRPAAQIVVGDQESDLGYVFDFHARQQRIPDGMPYRWTRGAGRIVLPGWGPGEYRLIIVMAAPLHPEPDVTVLVGDVPVGQARLSGDYVPYVFDVPYAATTGGDVEVTLESPRFRPPRDGRQVGIAVHQIALEPTGALPVAPATTGLIATIALGLTAYLALLLAGRSWRQALLGAVVAAAVLCALLAFDRLTIILLLRWMSWAAAIVTGLAVVLRVALGAPAPLGR